MEDESDQALPTKVNIQRNGHNTVDALRILHEELHEEICLYQVQSCRKSWRECLRGCFLHHANIHSVLHWTSVLVIAVCTALVLTGYKLQTVRDDWLVVEALFLLMALTVNIYFLAWDDQLRKTEHVFRAKEALCEIEKCMKDGLWNSTNYINIHAPQSPCVTLQWTVREAEVVNLPCGFLVNGDIILLRPGQIVPARCRPAQPEDGSTVTEEYDVGDIYNPDISRNAERHVSPELRQPLQPKAYVVLETPFLSNIREILRHSHDKPVSVLNNERYQMYSVWIERRVLPIIALLMLLTNLLRYMLLQDYVGHWAEMVLLQPIHAILPLTALVFPLMWKLLDAYGLARLLVAIQQMKAAPVTVQESYDDFNSDISQSRELGVQLPWRQVWEQFKMVLRGHANTLPRTSSLVHALGNITSFCCVDKKGVLSWPNPTAEKLFFLRNAAFSRRQQAPHTDSENANDIAQSDDESEGSVVREDQHNYDVAAEGRFEVLDLTQDPKNGYGLEFDDPSWKKYLDSLKPLGLNVLLNTCNMDTTDRYTEFADHVTCASLKREAAVPVVNRSSITIEALATVRKRCFCELSTKMGFSQKALDIFQLQQILGMYRHIPPAAPARDPLFHKSFIKYKMPMPNVFSVVAKEATSGISQLFSQGTADLLLDTCSDYWDGIDLCPLSETERKSIGDFYHRTSMSSYCTAFSYRPLTETIGEEFTNAYIEVPDTDEEFFPCLKTPTPTRAWDVQSVDHNGRPKAYHGSIDSLMETASTTSVHDVESCFRAQCNQIFIAMISMQYQAKQDIVQLIEELDSACIRFVHFSKENELRSRVFSEKMGLEAGWNCHVSLLSDEKAMESTVPSQPDLWNTANSSHFSSAASGRCHLTKISMDSIQGVLKAKSRLHESSRGRRCSAPGAINVERAQVKFVDSEPRQRLKAAVCKHEKEIPLEANAGCNADDPLLASTGVEKSISEKDSISSVPVKGSTEILNLSQSNSNVGECARLLGKDSGLLPETLSENLSNIDDVANMEQSAEKDEKMEEEKEDEDGEAAADKSSSIDSYPASSYITENTDSVTGALGLSNRAKLPKGIENIRPHIENVDNVPLLVSLFTDCTPQTTREMLQILQEYGEVVCCFGSSANIYHTGIFLQADCSLAVEPLYPQICMKEPVVSRPWDEAAPTPMEVSAKLHSIPCALAFDRDDQMGLIQLIALARQHCQSVRHTFLMLFVMQLSISLLQLLCAVLLLPPILGAHHLLWLLGIVLPVLSLAMMDCKLDLTIVKMAQGKNWNHMPRQVITNFLVYYLIRYVPALLLCVTSHGLTLTALCTKMQQEQHSNITCSVFYGDISHEERGTWNGWYTDYKSGLALSQDFVALQLAVDFICASLCFIHRFHHLWQKSPLRNKIWCIAAPLIVLCQALYLAINLAVQNYQRSIKFSITDIPVGSWVVALVSPLVLLPIHELVKHREIEQAVRYQKRARLDFGTKLGMNSPF